MVSYPKSGDPDPALGERLGRGGVELLVSIGFVGRLWPRQDGQDGRGRVPQLVNNTAERQERNEQGNEGFLWSVQMERG